MVSDKTDTNGFRCPCCGMVSHNPNDARWGYCGNCHRFYDKLDAQLRAEMQAVAGISEAQLTGVSDTKSDTNPILTVPKTDATN